MMNAVCRWLFPILLLCSALQAAEAELLPTPAEAPSKVEYLPGIALSQGITEITGVAISPLLGVSSIGAWRYWKAPAASRAALPWYAQPWAWGTGLAMLTLCFLKDTLGTAVPGLLKKPLDMVELFENKISALVASGAFVPLIASEMAKHLDAQRAIEVPTAAIGMGSAMASIDLTWLMVPAAVISFLLVWVCSHAINVLIIALAAWCAPSAMRLAIFGLRFASDILIPGLSRQRATPHEPHAFTLGRSTGLPPRTGGRLVMLDNGSTAFRYRRWCILDERTVPLPIGERHVEKGLFSPSLIHMASDGEVKMLLFLPRYKGHEESLARHLHLQGVREHPLARGWVAIKSWFGKGKVQCVRP